MDIEFYLSSLLVHTAFATGSIIGFAIFLVWAWWAGMRVARFNAVRRTFNPAAVKRARSLLFGPAIVGFAILAFNALALTYQPRVVITEQNPARQDYLDRANEAKAPEYKLFTTDSERLKASQPDTKGDLDTAVEGFREKTKP